MTFTWTIGKPFPASQLIGTYGLMSGPDCDHLAEDPAAVNVPITIDGAVTWLSVTKGTGYPVPLTAAVNPTNLVAGTYNAIVRVSPPSDQRCGVLEIPVTLSVLNPIKKNRGKGQGPR